MEHQFTPDRRRNRDRRIAPRTADSGIVEISFDVPAPITIQAELVESNAFGFRAAHDSKVLEPGLEVRYTRTGASGQARVIWTHVLDGRRVSGFLVQR